MTPKKEKNADWILVVICAFFTLSSVWVTSVSQHTDDVFKAREEVLRFRIDELSTLIIELRLDKVNRNELMNSAFKGRKN